MINYTIKKTSKTRSLRISVHCSRGVTVSAPIFLPDYKINEFVLKKEAWILKKIEHFSKFEKLVFPKVDKSSYILYKKQAEVLVKNRLEYFNAFYKYSFNKISIKKQKTRWGSCSKKRNLNFNYKIIFLPEDIADYLIVHELCHLKELNHSKNFWLLVSQTLADYKTRNSKLKKYIF